MKWLCWICLLGVLCSPSGLASNSGDVVDDIKAIETWLAEWQFAKAKRVSEQLLKRYPKLPVVQLEAAWVGFHFGEHQRALELVQQVFSEDDLPANYSERLALIRAAAHWTKGFATQSNKNNTIIVTHRPGPDEILVPYLIETIERSLQVIGEDLDVVLDHPVFVEILPNAQALAQLTGLAEEKIETSGTIAVCKYNRLMITSLRSTFKGYSWLDTISHELAHMLVSKKTRNHTQIWLHEALARLEDSRWRAAEPWYREGLSPLEESHLAQAIRENRLIPFEQMHPSMALLPNQEAVELAFSEVQMAAFFLLEQKGYSGIRQLLEELDRGQSDFDAIASVYGMNRSGFVQNWFRWMKSKKLQILEGKPWMDQLTVNKKTSGSGRGLVLKNPIDVRDHFHLGELLRARGRLEASVIEYQKAVDRAGTRHSVLWILANKLGLALMGLSRNQEAQVAFRLGLTINPHDLEAHLHLAALLAHSDPDSYQAFMHIRECLRINPLDPRVQTQCVAITGNLKNKKDSREDFVELFHRCRQALQVLGVINDSETVVEHEKTFLKPAENVGEITIRSRPWSRIWLDFVDTGLTTPVVALKLPTGFHVLGLVASCRDQPLVLSVFVSAKQPVVIEQELCKEFARP